MNTITTSWSRDRVRDARFSTLNCKIAHYFNRECGIFAFIIQYLVNTWKLRPELVKITHKTGQNRVIWHIKIFSDIIPDGHKRNQLDVL